LVLAMAAIVATMAALGGGPAVAAKAGDIVGVLPDQGEPGPGCEGLVNASQKSGNQKVKANAAEHDCLLPPPPQPPPF
jgi:hypothetical protein